MPFTVTERAYLESQRLGRIATVSRKGTPDVAVVGFSLDEDRFVIGGMELERTLKYINAEATGKAAFVVDDQASIDPWRPRGVKVRGRAVVQTGANGAYIAIEPQVIWSWGMKEGVEPHHAANRWEAPEEDV